jgi:hypothetical protein
MWAGVPKDGHVDHQILESDGSQVKASISWTYTLAGKQVKNEETSWLTIEDGKITRQREEMNFGRWAHQLVPLPEAVLNFAEPVLAPLLRFGTEIAKLF